MSQPRGPPRRWPTLVDEHDAVAAYPLPDRVAAGGTTDARLDESGVMLMVIEVAAEAFGPDAHRGSYEHVIITGAADPGAAAAALSRAGARFYSVTDDGRELSKQQLREEEAPATGTDPPYTPNWVSEVRLAPRGPWCSR